MSKPQTKNCTAELRILYKFDGKDIHNPGTTSLSIKIIDLECFPLAFKYADSYHPEHYEMAVDQLKQNPTRLISLVQIKETGYYEMQAKMLCHLMFNQENQLVDCLWKIVGAPNVLQLSEDEVELLKERKII